MVSEVFFRLSRRACFRGAPFRSGEGMLETSQPVHLPYHCEGEVCSEGAMYCDEAAMFMMRLRCTAMEQQFLC